MCSDTPLPPQPPLPGPSTALGKLWLLLRLTGEGFIEDDDWSRGASIAYFTLFSVAPSLLVVIAVAGLVYLVTAKPQRRLTPRVPTQRPSEHRDW